MRFVNLHAHTTMSFLDGYGTEKQVVDRLDEIGHNQCAITDHGNIIAHVPYYRAMQKANKKAILGCEFYIVDDHTEKKSRHNPLLGVDGAPHITVLAMNQKGYENLTALSTLSWREGFYYKPRIDWDLLVKYQEGLCVLTGCVGGYPSTLINNPDRGPQAAWDFIGKYNQRIEHLYMELIPQPGLDICHSAMPWLMKIANDLDMSMVMTADAHFPRPEDHVAEDTMVCIGLRTTMADTKRKVRLPSFQYYCTGDELLDRADRAMIGHNNPRTREQLIQAINNSAIIADMCNVEIPKAKPLLYPGIRPADPADVLWSWLEAGLAKRIATGRIPMDQEPVYRERMELEFGRMKEKKFCDYILCLTDICRWAKSKDTLVMCRGSAGGCLLLYLLECSETDSVLHDLDFDRFFDPTRMDPPDIDVDFETWMKQPVYEYIASKYGEKNVCQILSLGLIRARVAVQDVAAVHGIHREQYAPLSNALDSKDDDVDKQIRLLTDPTAIDVLRRYPIFNMIDGLVGQARQPTIHAAGVLISSEELTKTMGIMHQPGKTRVSSVDKDSAAWLGFLKLDLLTVAAYDVLATAVRNIGANMAWLHSLPFDDPGVYALAKTSKVAGVFQIDGAAIKIGDKVGLDKFDEIYAISALCRPGAVNHVPLYCRNKFSPHDFQKYLSSIHPIAAEIVRKTYGVLLYQEQVMKICNKLALMPMPMVQKLRKRIASASSIGFALGEEYSIPFFAGCEKNGVSQTEASYWWESLKAHGIYSFNKAHCVTYGIVGYWMLYMKAHYPEAYFASYLMHEGNNSNPNKLLMKRLIRDFRNTGGTLDLIDLKHSKESFASVGPNRIAGGWANIAGIGDKQAKMIVDKRPYESWAAVKNTLPVGLYYKLHEAGITGHMPFDQQAAIELASWLPVQATGGDEMRIKHDRRLAGPGDLPEDEKIRDAVLSGYLTAIHKRGRTGFFHGDQIIYCLEDENGAIEFRVPHRNPKLATLLKAQVKTGDYIAVSGGWTGEMLFIDDFELLHRRV